ncbi:MAG TPA: hypothetical protein VH583_01655 [Vicinamibacterales bacterium]
MNGIIEDDDGRLTSSAVRVVLPSNRGAHRAPRILLVPEQERVRHVR